MTSNFDLWMEFKKSPSVGLKKQIILQYSNLVHYVIQHSKFVKSNVIDERDFYQFGIEGLSEAIDRFDPEYGTKFETYAIQRIRGKIIDEIRKIEAKQRLENAKADLSLNQSFDGDDGYMLYETLPGDSAQPDEEVDQKEEKEILLMALKTLNERDRLIITLYYYENLNYKEISEVLNITVSRISQIHSRIMGDLKQKFLALQR